MPDIPTWLGDEGALRLKKRTTFFCNLARYFNAKSVQKFTSLLPISRVDLICIRVPDILFILPYGGGEGCPKAGNASLSPSPEGLVHQLALRRRVDPPEAAFAWLLLRPRHLDKVPVERQVVPDGVLPPLVRSAVVRVVFGNVRIDPRQGQLFVRALRHGLHYQLGVTEGRLGLILEK